MPDRAWWFRPVKNEALVGEHREVTWKRLKGAPAAASESMCGVPMSEPNAPRWPKPVSSSTITTTFGAAGVAWVRAGGGVSTRPR